jgi:hypothetical protein
MHFFVVVTQDARKILSIPDNMALPPGVNDPILVDLGQVAVRTRSDSLSSV